MTEPIDIIKAFDEVLDYVYGRRWGRDYQHKSDEETARSWCAEGLTVPLATMVFFNRMNYMHEKWLRQSNLSDRSNIPHSLKIFDENIHSAIRRAQNGGSEIEPWELIESQWRARVLFWLTEKIWNEDMFGPSPDDSACRTPHRLLIELLPKLWKKNDSGKIIFIKNNS